MNLLTTTGYKSIEDCNIGEQLIAYDVFDGSVILNELLEKQWMSPDMFEDEYSIPEQVVDEDGNPVFEQVPVLDENGNPVYVQVPVLDEDGNPVYEQVPVLDEDGNPTYVQVPVVDEDGYLVFDEEGNQVFENGEQIFQQGNQVFENGEQIFEDGDPVMTEPVLLRTKKQIFEETYGELSAYRVNDTWDLYWGQSIWADLNVVHAQDLQVGDIVYDDNDNDIEIASIEKVDVDGWWRLSVSGDHSFIDDGITLHNASRYWVGGGANSNWNATGNTNWGSASGGANNASVPTSVDDVIFDGAGVSGNTDSTISASITILSLDIQTGYTATMTHNANLSIAGNWTYTSGYAIAGASGITITAASTITSNGRTWPNSLSIAASLFTVHTIIGNLTVGGLFIVLQAAQTFTTSTSGVLTLQNGIQVNYQFGSGSVTPVDIYLTGGTWSGINVIAFTNLYLQGNVTLSGTVTTYAGSITYISGVITTTGSTLNLQFSATLNTNGVTWNNIGSVNASKTITLTSNLLMSGVFSINQNTIVNTSNSSTWTVGGGITLDVNRTLSGTAKIILTGGTWSGGGVLSNNLDINGNVTVSGSVSYSTNTLTYVSGTVTTTGSTLSIPVAGATLNTAGMIWNNVNIPSFFTPITLLSNFSMSGLLSQLTGNATINTSVGATWTTSGGMSLSYAVGGTAKLIITGGTWSGGGAVQSNLDIDGNITISGTVGKQGGILTYVSGTVTTTGSTLSIPSGATTLNSGSITWNNITCGVATITLTSNLSLNGTLTTDSTTINRTTTETVTVANGIAINGGTTGSAKIILTGGTWSGGGIIGLSNNLDIQGNVTISGTLYYSTGTLTYISGTVTTTGSTLAFNRSFTTTLNTNGIIWDNISVTNDFPTLNLTSNLSLSGLLSVVANALIITTSVGATCTTSGGISVSASRYIDSSANLYLTGGTWSGAGEVRANLFIDGNVTISGSVSYRLRTLTYVSGTVTVTGSTLNITGSCTLNTSGMVWNNVSFNGTSATHTLTSNFSMSGLLTVSISTSINTSVGATWTTSGGVSVAINQFLGGTAALYLTGGTWSGVGGIYSNTYIDGNLTIVGIVSKSGYLKYVSGAVNTLGSNIQLLGACTLDTKGMSFYNVQCSSVSGAITLQSDLFINNLLNITYVNGVFNKTTNERVYTSSLYVGWPIQNTADFYITGGGQVSSGDTSYFFGGNLYVTGDTKFVGSFVMRSGTLGILSGNVTGVTCDLRLEFNNTLIGRFDRVPFRSVFLLSTNSIITMDYFFSGVPSLTCVVNASTFATINFTDGFEKIGRFVKISNVGISRPNQLLVTTNPRFNTNRSAGIRYLNQSPNGFAKSSPSIYDNMKLPALGLLSDPNFTVQ